MSPLHVRSEVCMSPFHVRSKVCIAPIHVRSKFADFAPHMDGSNADFAPHIEGSHADFAPHTERRHSFRDRKIAEIAYFCQISKIICSKHLYLRCVYDLFDNFKEWKYFEGEYL